MFIQSIFKVDDITGELYVALRLDWHINNEFIQSRNVTFWLQINQFEHDETAISTIFMKIYGFRNEEENAKKNRTLFHIDFQAFIDKKLQIGRTYDLTLFYKTDDGLKTFISSKTLDIPMIHLDAEDNRTIHCDAEHIEKSRKIAARWVSAIYTEEKHINPAVSITFYAAPKWFCFDSYEIGIWEDDTPLKSVIVTNDQLYRNGSNWMGNVTFFDLLRNSSYFVTVIQKIFILNPNVEKSKFVTEIAQFLQSKGLTVFYLAFDIKHLEENAFYYVHKAIADSDKIILFHGNKTQKFIDDGKSIYDRISSNYFDNAFIIALSLLKLNDSKILHANFIDDNLNSSKFLITETLYTLPRDLSYLFQGLRLQIDQTAINHLNDSFNIQKDSETNELESIIVCRNDSPEIIRNEEAESVINSIGIIENNNEKTDISDQSNTDSGFHSI
uniref:ILCR1 Ig-like domain-containing protein n=1 Tax=Panagrolaimus davidi TaxID=227884 RepID=A0A914Q7S6_9BILA